MQVDVNWLLRYIKLTEVNLASLMEPIQEEQTLQSMVNQRGYELLPPRSSVSALTTATLNLNLPSHAPVIQLVNTILLNAINKQASDVHFEPYETRYRIRYRVDGILIETFTIDLNLARSLTARIKIMANLDIAQSRLPQDGRFKIKTNSAIAIDCRVSICPTVDGEKIVIRILNPAIINVPLQDLGFNSVQKTIFLNAITQSQGMVLVTGPTGSGKTVSLYAALAFLNTQDKNIATVEDPVEIKLPGINQVHVNPQIGLTFATTLRAFLRQDPDIIMVGEIRDLETAEIAIQAAQTGHLVLSTLHTNSAAQTIIRLINMGIPAFNIASAVSLLLAQRLVRRLCNKCKIIHSNITDESLAQFDFAVASLAAIPLYRAQGCADCIDGYRGCTALFEVMRVSERIAEMIIKGCSDKELQQQAQIEGMLTIQQSGYEKIIAGVTSIEEVKRVLPLAQ